MSVFMWFVAGAAAAWFAGSVLGLDAARALMVSAIVAIVGVIFGGDALAPAIASHGGENVLSPFMVLLASVAAIGSVKVAAGVYRYFQVPAIDQHTANKSL